MERLLSETRLVVGLNLMIGVAMSYVHCLLCNGEARRMSAFILASRHCLPPNRIFSQVLQIPHITAPLKEQDMHESLYQI